MIVNMRGVWVVVSKASAVLLAFGGTVHAVDNFRCHDSFFTVVVDSTLDSRVDAYIEPVRISKAKMKDHDRDAVVLRELSEMWINKAKYGKLSQIFPGYFGESLLEGPKGDVFLTCTSLSNKLSECADQEAGVGNPNACLDAVRCLELIDIVRYGSYETMFTSTAYLRKPLKILKSNMAKFTPEVKSRLQKVEDIQGREHKTQLLTQLVDHQKTQYSVRYGKLMAKEDDSSYLTYLKGRRSHIAAEHFFGFDRTVGLSPNKMSN